MSDVCAFVFVFRYNELLFIIDTCQGASMYERFYSPNLMALASSQVGEDSLSVSCSHRCRRATFPVVSPFLNLKRCVISQHNFAEDKAVSLCCILCSLAFSKTVCQLPRDIGHSTFSTFLLQK